MIIMQLGGFTLSQIFGLIFILFYLFLLILFPGGAVEKKSGY